MKTSLLSCLVLTVALVLSAGCASGPSSRIKKNQAAFERYPADVQTLIKDGRVKTGFTPEQTELALGKPDRVLHRTTEDGVSEVWLYLEKGSRFGVGLGVGLGTGPVGGGVGVGTGTGGEIERMRVTFVAGRVTAVEQSGR
jgi:hypothetical protein